LSGLLKQNTKFFFRQDTMFSSDTLQCYICVVHSPANSTKHYLQKIIH